MRIARHLLTASRPCDVRHGRLFPLPPIHRLHPSSKHREPSNLVYSEGQSGFRTCCSVTRGTQKAPPTPLAAAAAASAACLASDRVVVHLAAADSAARLSCEQTDDVRCRERQFQMREDAIG